MHLWRLTPLKAEELCWDVSLAFFLFRLLRLDTIGASSEEVLEMLLDRLVEGVDSWGWTFTSCA